MNADRFPAVMAAAAHGRVLADNAAGAQLPDSALERMQRYLAYENAQRGTIFARPAAVGELLDVAKAEFASLIGVPVHNVGIGANSTTIAMTFSRLLASTILRGDRIVVTAADHEANVAPWTWLRRFGAQIDVVPVDAHGDLDESKYRSFLQRAPVLVALPWASNVTGTVFDVARLASMAKAARALVVVDGVQALPHFALDIDPAIDFAFFSAYKMFAPHLAFWYASSAALARYVRVDDDYVPGGDARYWTIECGTPSYEALAGWLGTIAYLREIGGTARDAFPRLQDHERSLARHAADKFAERAPQLRLYGRAPHDDRLPVFSFNIAGMASDDLGRRFEVAKIEARVGDYYAPRTLQRLAAEHKSVAVRLSFAHYNSKDDVDRCFDVIDAALGRRAEAPSGAFAT